MQIVANLVDGALFGFSQVTSLIEGICVVLATGLLYT